MITINTAEYGTHEVHAPRGVKAVVGGLWWNGLIEVAVYTRADERAGYLIQYNVQTRERRLKRLKCTYTSAESRKQYGRKAVTEILPIL